MVLNFLFELEDQIDEDFFDKLVNDDDDDVIGGGLKSIGLMKVRDVLDGDEFDEVKVFVNLSINEGGNVNDVLENIRVIRDDDNVGEVYDILDGDKFDEVKVGNVNDCLELIQVIGDDNNVREERVEVKK